MNEEMNYQDDQFTEDQIEAINMLEEEGLKLISTPLQIKNGTLMFKDTKLKNVYYSITKSGYARRHLKGEVFSPWARKLIPQNAMYQLNKKRSESMYSASEDRYTELSRITQPGDYSGLADIILRVVNRYRHNNHNESKQENNLRAKTVNESLNEDIFSHPEAWTYKPGDEVRFYMKDVSPEEFGDEEEGELAASHDKMKAIITSQATATATVDELGDKNYEYYDIEFGDGIEIPAVSGYHLEPTYSKKRSDHWDHLSKPNEGPTAGT
jgi:plastocyanin